MTRILDRFHPDIPDLTVRWTVLMARRTLRLHYLYHEFGEDVFRLRAWEDAMLEFAELLDERGFLSELFRITELNTDSEE